MASNIYEDSGSPAVDDKEEENPDVSLFEEDELPEVDPDTTSEEEALPEDFIMEDDAPEATEELSEDGEAITSENALEVLHIHENELADLKREFSYLREDLDEARKLIAALMGSHSDTKVPAKKPSKLVKRKKRTSAGRPIKEPPKVRVPKRKPATKKKKVARYK